MWHEGLGAEIADTFAALAVFDRYTPGGFYVFAASGRAPQSYTPDRGKRERDRRRERMETDPEHAESVRTKRRIYMREYMRARRRAAA